MRLSLDALAVLDAIDRRGSFAAAAAELHRVPSALTYVVQKLEQDLDVQVFDRSGHRAKLTAAGEELLREGRHLLRAAREVEARVRRVSRGWEIELVIAMDEIVPIERLYPLVAAFHGLGHGTRLKLLEEILAGTWDALLTGRADLVIGASGDPPTDGGCTTAALGSMPFVFAVAPTHPIATEPEPIAHATLLAHRAVLAADSA
ncbi:MAG: LysR family transcriptional regulator, partial [Burkholderiales bacterium]|nr:LysR family transcriptional regulator [Burkholderiales bacterium]